MILRCVPQSISLIIISWATSTNLRVRYPESAVLNAVSTKPFLAPYDDIIYSVTVRPSLKLLLIGRSIICPCGSAINPLIPTSCLTCEIFPLAPENAIIYTGFNGSVSLKYLTTSVFNSSLALFQVSITLWNLSIAVISPLSYCSSVNCIASFVLLSKFFLLGGTLKSSTLSDIPAFVS